MHTYPHTEIRQFDMGTCLHVTRQWGFNLRNGHRALCADGTVRAVEVAEVPDTFFSTPAKVRIGGRWVSGYVTMYDNGISWHLDGYQGPELPERTLVFRHHMRHADAFSSARPVF